MTLRTKLITLDVTNTILRIKGGVGGVYKSVGSKFGFEAMSEVPTTSINSSFKNSFKQHWHKHPNFGFGHMPAKDWWTNVTMDTLRSFTSDVDLKNAAQFCDVLHQEFSTTSTYEIIPTTSEALQKLHEGCPDIVVITNNDSRIRHVIQDMFPSHLFRHIIISNEEGIYKPDERIFLKAMEGMRLSRDEVMHIGDSYTADYVPAKSLGMRAVLLSSPGTGNHCQCPQVDQISELHEAVALLRIF